MLVILLLVVVSRPLCSPLCVSILCPCGGDLTPTNSDTNGGGLKYANVGFPIHSYINEPHNNNTQPPTHRRNSDNDPRSGTRAGRTGSGTATYSYDRQMDTCATVMTTVPEGRFTPRRFLQYVCAYYIVINRRSNNVQ